MSDLIEFLRARIAEDEQQARDLQGTAYAAWHYEPDPDRAGGRVVGSGKLAEVANDWSNPGWPAAYVGVSRHIARWDPARVLAECDAKRKRIERHSGRTLYCAWTHYPETEHVDMPPCDTLKLEALPYADHPDYREKWRP